jgi:short-subunit dehydrogenase
LAPYCASKRTLDIFFKGLANECIDDNIKIVSIKPGVIKTPIWEKSIPAARENFAKLPAEAQEKYTQKLDRMLKYAEASIKKGLCPDVVAKKTLCALKAKHPKMSYNVGVGAYIGCFLGKLSEELQHKLTRMRF